MSDSSARCGATYRDVVATQQAAVIFRQKMRSCPTG